MSGWDVYRSLYRLECDVSDGMEQIPRVRLANLRLRRETSDILASESQVFNWHLGQFPPMQHSGHIHTAGARLLLRLSEAAAVGQSPGRLPATGDPRAISWDGST
jgi:hypothetical protein